MKAKILSNEFLINPNSPYNIFKIVKNMSRVLLMYSIGKYLIYSG